MGMVLILEGLPYFAFPDKIKSYLLKVVEMPSHLLRMIGFCAVAAGLLFVYLGRN